MLLSNLLYAILLGVAGAISLFLAIYAWRRRAMTGAFWFAMMMLACAVWSISGIGESLTVDLAAKIIWSQLSYLGIASLPVAWFLFTVRFSGRDKFLKKSTLWLFWLIPIITLVIAATSQWHHWLWSAIAPINDLAGAPAVYSYGWWFWINIAYSYILTLLGIGWLIATAARAKGLLRRQARLLMMGGFIPIIGNVLYVFKLNPWPPYDLGPVMFVITGIMVSWAIFRWQLLDIVPAAEKVIVAQMTDGEIILDPQDKIVEINKSAKKILGVNFIPPGSDGATWLQRLGLPPAFYRQEKSDQKNIEYQNYYLKVTVNPFLRLGDQLAGRIITLRDLSAQRAAEISYRQEEKKFHDIFNLAQDAMFIHDLQGHFIEVNQAACQRLGYSREELMSMTPQDIDAPEYAKNVPAKIEELQKKGAAIFQTEHIARDGHRIPTELSSKIITWQGQSVIVSIARDITERAKAEAKLRQSTQEIADLYNNAPCGYHSLGPDGTIMRINDTELKWLGYRREEVVGKKKYLELFTLPSQKKFQEKFPIFLKQGFINNVDFVVRRKDGTTFPILVNATAVRDDTGKLIMSRSTVFDITKLKQAEELLNKKLQESEKLNRLMTGRELKMVQLKKALEAAQKTRPIQADTAVKKSEEATRRADKLSQLIEQKSANLEKFNQLMVGRELRMVKLKEEIEKLRLQLKEAPEQSRPPAPPINWREKFQAAVELEEAVIGKLKNTYLAEIDRSALSPAKRNAARKLVQTLVAESEAHELKFEQLKKNDYGK